MGETASLHPPQPHGGRADHAKPKGVMTMAHPKYMSLASTTPKHFSRENQVNAPPQQLLGLVFSCIDALQHHTKAGALGA